MVPLCCFCNPCCLSLWPYIFLLYIQKTNAWKHLLKNFGKSVKVLSIYQTSCGSFCVLRSRILSLSFSFQISVAGLDTDFWWLCSAVTSFKYSALKIFVWGGAGCRQMCLRSALEMKDVLACCAILFLLNVSNWDLPRGKDVSGNQSEVNWLALSFELGWLFFCCFFSPTVIFFFFLLNLCGNPVLFYCIEVLLQTVDLAAKILVLCFS